MGFIPHRGLGRVGWHPVLLGTPICRRHTPRASPNTDGRIVQWPTTVLSVRGVVAGELRLYRSNWGNLNTNTTVFSVRTPGVDPGDALFLTRESRRSRANKPERPSGCIPSCKYRQFSAGFLSKSRRRREYFSSLATHWGELSSGPLRAVSIYKNDYRKYIEQR